MWRAEVVRRVAHNEWERIVNRAADWRLACGQLRLGSEIGTGVRRY